MSPHPIRHVPGARAAHTGQRPAWRPTIAALALAASASAQAQVLGPAFTYQGQLTESGQPANGLYDLQACLYDSPGSAQGLLLCTPEFSDVPVEDGVFTLALNLGAGSFAGLERYLELLVRPGASSGPYTPLSPRQLVRAVPEALRARAASAAPWTGLTGVPAGFADGIDHDSGGTLTSITAGAGLSGGTITGSGTLGIANGGVGSLQVADGSIAAVDVAPDSLGSAQLASNAVAAAELADNAVDTSAVQNLAITQGKLAPGAVGAAQLAAGAVGAAQIDTTQVQARVTGSCAIGEYLRGIDAGGSVACEPVPGLQRITLVQGTAAVFYPALVIGAGGRSLIGYYDASVQALKVVACANAACTGATTVTTVDDPPANDVGYFTAMAIGADGNPVISYYDFTAGALKVAQCTTPTCAGAATISTVDNAADVGVHTAIAVPADGLPVISYHDLTAGTLKVAKCSVPACTSAVVTTVDDPAGQVGLYTAIAIGADGLPVISYLDSSATALKVARCANPACSGVATITTVDDPANAVGTYTDIAIGTDGLPVISYRDATAKALKVAKCSNAACSAASISTVDDPPANHVGEFTSIAVGPDSLPVISHWDAAAGALRVAKCASASCSGAATITTVDDPAGVIGTTTTIVIGSDGLPTISYGDGGILKVARCGTRSCL